MTYTISDDRFKKQRRADATGKPKKVQINVLVEPVRRQAIQIYLAGIGTQLRPLRGPKFRDPNTSDLLNDYLDRDPHFRAIERKLKRENTHVGRSKRNIGIDV